MTKTIELVQQRGGVPTATVSQARLRIFQPTRRPVMLDQMIATAWGRIRVKGRLGQQHDDVLESIMFCGRRPRDIGDGRIKLLVDPADVRRRARQDGTTLRRVLDDLMQAIVEIIEPTPMAETGHLIDRIKPANVSACNPLGGERSLWRVELGPVLCKMLAADLWQYRDPQPIAQLRHGISQAVARHVLSHREGTCDHWSIDTLIKAVAGDLSGRAMLDRKRELAADVDALQAIGVTSQHLLELKAQVEARKRGGVSKTAML